MQELRRAIVFETTVARYSATAIVGEGGAGKVYKATADSGELVAVKLLDPAKGASKEGRRRFRNELSFGSRNRHPNVVTVLDHGPFRIGDDVTPFYVMPLYGSTLRDALKKGVLPTQVLAMFSQILNGVEAAHLQGVVHRDLKPENIMHDAAANRWVMGDFGVAEFTHTRGTLYAR